MRDVTEWLAGLGLGQYAELFAKNAIDLRALPHLTDDDLTALEVPLGHRRILLAAVADLDKQSATPSEAERRQLTVLFSDLVGSTALSSPEVRTLDERYEQAKSGIDPQK